MSKPPTRLYLKLTPCVTVTTLGQQGFGQTDEQSGHLEVCIHAMATVLPDRFQSSENVGAIQLHKSDDPFPFGDIALSVVKFDTSQRKIPLLTFSIGAVPFFQDNVALCYP